MQTTPPRARLVSPLSASLAAGPSGSSGAPPPTPNPRRPGQEDLWTDILRSADRQKALGRKNVVLLSERYRGRSLLLDKLVGRKRRKEALALGYEVLTGEERDEDAAPPVSLLYPPSSHPSLLQLVDVSLPPNPLPNTAVVIVLDWSRPGTMVRELLQWLGWVESWAQRAGERDGVDREEMFERLKSHLQHYTEPGNPTLPSYSGTVLPLSSGTLTRNSAGVPVIVVCTRADQMDAVGDELGMKGGGWEERTDWIQQVLRTICLAHGAALFYTAPTQPETYANLKEYLFHRLYSSPESKGRFPFAHKANVLDRDAVMVPSGWDSWGKINVLREGFDPARVARAWDVSCRQLQPKTVDPTVIESEDGEDESLEDLWVAMVPDTERPTPAGGAGATTTSEPEQAFLQRQLDVLAKDPSRAKETFRQAAGGAGEEESKGVRFALGGGVVGPMGAGGLALPGVKKAMAEMEGDVERERRREMGKPTSPGGERSGTNEALHNFFQGLLAKKAGSAAGTPTKPPPK